MDVGEYNEERKKIEKKYQNQLYELDKERHKDFKRKYFKNKDHLIVLDKKNSLDELVYRYSETESEHPIFADLWFWKICFTTEYEFINQFGKIQGGGTPVQITREEFVLKVGDKMNNILDG